MVKDDVEEPRDPGDRTTLELSSLPSAAEIRGYIRHGRVLWPV